MCSSVPQSGNSESTTYCRVESREMGKSLEPRALWRTLWSVLTAGLEHMRAELTCERMEKGCGMCSVPSVHPCSWMEGMALALILVISFKG